MFILDRCQDILLEDLSITVAAGKELVAAAWIQNTPLKTDQKGECPPNA